MELIRKILATLEQLQTKKQTDHNQSNPAVNTRQSMPDNFPHKTWDDFIVHIDNFVADSNSREHDVLKRIVYTGVSSQDKLGNLFQELGQESDWQALLSFSDLPVAYDDTALDEAMNDYCKFDLPTQDHAGVSQIFSQLNPTNLELLTMLLNGYCEFYPDATSQSIKLLVDRENAARAQIVTLLNQPWDDMIRWWLVKSANSLPDASRLFVKNSIRNKADARLSAMTLPMLLRYGLEWSSRYRSSRDKVTAEAVCCKEYLNKIGVLLSLINKPE